MGQITNPIVLGITVNPVDRQSGPLAGSGSTSNQAIFFGSGAGKNSAVNDLIVIGNSSGGGGLADNANLEGTTVVGVGSLNALTVGIGNALPITLLGSDNANVLQKGDSSLIAGSNILTAYTGSGTGLSTSVFLGNTLMPTAIGNAGGTNGAVLIGFNILPNSAVLGAVQNSVLIGNAIGANVGGGVISNSVFIGNGVAPSITNTADGNILIGRGADTSTAGTSNINIGAFAKQRGVGSGAEQNNLLLGNATQSSGNLNVIIGTNAIGPANNVANACVGNVIIGAGAGATLQATDTSILLIEANTVAGPAGALIYGRFDTGNLILGASTFAANRDLAGAGAANITKLLNGTKGAANPIGGGYFYVTGGVLHWVDSAGVDSQLSENVAGQLASSALVAYTNNAAAAAGTLTNAPVAGNPTKWIPINDNGTIRNIPAW